jgi:hypothetical protein
MSGYTIPVMVGNGHLVPRILPAALSPGLYSASNRKEYQSREIMFLRSRVRLMSKVNILTAICDPIV